MIMFSRDRSCIIEGVTYRYHTSGFDKDSGLAGRYTYSLSGKSFTADIVDCATGEIVQTVHARNPKTALHHARIEILRNGGLIDKHLIKEQGNEPLRFCTNNDR